MADDDRLVEFLAEMLIKQDKMVEELQNIKGDIGKLNLLSAENNRAILKLANQLEQFINLEPRVRKLESAVFK